MIKFVLIAEREMVFQSNPKWRVLLKMFRLSKIFFRELRSECEISGFLRSFQRFSIVTSTESALANLEAKCAIALPECSTVDDEMTKIRHEFELAKQRFLNIPEALKSMPKMNRRGIYVNKNMRLNNIQVYRFDYDYTLAHYFSHLQSLYDLAKQHMINEFKTKFIT